MDPFIRMIMEKPFPQNDAFMYPAGFWETLGKHPMDDIKPGMCACGQPLHYKDPKIQKMVTDLINKTSPNVDINIIGVGKFRVQRHYLALHGLKAMEALDLVKAGIIERLDTPI